jgi:uncharacterized membrane protein
MWSVFEIVFLLLWSFIIIALTAMLVVALLGGLVAIVYERLSDILWSIKETWKEYWK